MGEEFKTKIHYPKVKSQERIINPPKGNQKKKIYERERESYHILVWEIWIKWEIIVYL